MVMSAAEEGLYILAYRRGGALLLGFGTTDGGRAKKYFEPVPNNANYLRL
jgi:hypothetical protein